MEVPNRSEPRAAIGSGRGVLVTGSHRSGSTWVGRVLAAADELHYVHEPFNIVARVRWTAHRPAHQFLYIEPGAEPPFASEVRRALQLRLPVAPQLAEALRGRRTRRLVRTAADARRARRQGKRPLVKDPIALFSTEWLVEAERLDPVILVREPVSFVGSLKERQWGFDFRHWTEQPTLMNGLLKDHRHAIEAQVASPGSIVEQGIVQWNAFYHAVDQFRVKHPDWLVVRYEDLARDPMTAIPSLFERLGLTFGERQRTVLADLSGGKTGAGTSAMDVKRDSRKALDTWRDRLSETEIAAIKRGTEEIASHYYR